MSTFECRSTYGGCTFKPVVGVAKSWPIVCLQLAAWSRPTSALVRQLNGTLESFDSSPIGRDQGAPPVRNAGAPHASAQPANQVEQPSKCSPHLPA